jgi:GT2 family glycosyltransferase
MSQATFSVVIPTYNRGKLLPVAVESALSQTCTPLEILVVDDGSTDDTREVARGFPSQVTYIRQENGGVSVARNRGIKKARGDIVAFLDSDDAWEPDKLEVHAEVHRRWPAAGWALSDSLIVDDNLSPYPGSQGFLRGFPVFGTRTPQAFFGSVLIPDRLEAAGRVHEVFRGDAFRLLLQGNFLQESALTVRRSMIVEIGGFDESIRMAIGTDLGLRLGAASPMTCIMTPLVRWRVGSHDSIINSENSITLVRNAIASLDRAAAMRQLHADDRAAYKAGLEALWLRLTYVHLSNLEGTPARESLRRAFDAGVPKSPRAMGLWAASLLPSSVLKALHKIKRLRNRA